MFTRTGIAAISLMGTDRQARLITQRKQAPQYTALATDDERSAADAIIEKQVKTAFAAANGRINACITEKLGRLPMHVPNVGVLDCSSFFETTLKTTLKTQGVACLADNAMHELKNRVISTSSCPPVVHEVGDTPPQGFVAYRARAGKRCARDPSGDGAPNEGDEIHTAVFSFVTQGTEETAQRDAMLWDGIRANNGWFKGVTNLLLVGHFANDADRNACMGVADFVQLLADESVDVGKCTHLTLSLDFVDSVRNEQRSARYRQMLEQVLAVMPKMAHFQLRLHDLSLTSHTEILNISREVLASRPLSELHVFVSDGVISNVNWQYVDIEVSNAFNTFAASHRNTLERVSFLTKRGGCGMRPREFRDFLEGFVSAPNMRGIAVCVRLAVPGQAQKENTFDAPKMADMIGKVFPNLTLQASVVCGVSNVQELFQWKEFTLRILERFPKVQQFAAPVALQLDPSRTGRSRAISQISGLYHSTRQELCDVMRKHQGIHQTVLITESNLRSEPNTPKDMEACFIPKQTRLAPFLQRSLRARSFALYQVCVLVFRCNYLVPKNCRKCAVNGRVCAECTKSMKHCENCTASTRICDGCKNSSISIFASMVFEFLSGAPCKQVREDFEFTHDYVFTLHMCFSGLTFY